MGLKNKKAFITGISYGIGKSLAIKLANSGSDVIGISRTKPEYISDYPNICWFSYDLSKDFNNEEFLSGIRANNITALDFVILNAAQAHYGKVLDMNSELLKTMFNINIISSIKILQVLYPMIKPGGTVVFVGSSAAYFPSPNNAIYGALKAAQGHLAQSLNIEYMKNKIKFKVLRPGFTATPMAEKTGRPEKLSGNEFFWNLHPDIVANDIIKLCTTSKFMINTGWLSKTMCIMNKISSKLCFWFSVQRHKDYL